MKLASLWSLTLVSLLTLPSLGTLGRAQTPQLQLPVTIPEPGVPQIMTLEGAYVRAVYNNEGYAILGYRLANMSIGEEWMLLEFGTTILDKVPTYQMKREHLSLDTPDGNVPLATLMEFRNAHLAALQTRQKAIRDSINYFPPMAAQPCVIGFFTELADRNLPYEEVPVLNTRACLGRLFFHVPGGIKYGQYWLNVKFEKSVVRVPFRILTKDEEKFVSKNLGDIRKQVKEAFKPKK